LVLFPKKGLLTLHKQKERDVIIPVILGSVRRDRIGIRAARLMIAAINARGHEAVLVDPMQSQLPMLDRMYKEHPKGEAPPEQERLASLYRRADGFVVVSGEYNHSIPPALKNLLDYFLEEYFWRPSGIVCYSAGQFGGVRAAMQLRATLSELGMPSVPTLFALPKLQQIVEEDGTPNQDWIAKALGRFLDEFFWYAEALGRQRAAGTPY
jgi:NAD(P)H-dependent FMN reductase